MRRGFKAPEKHDDGIGIFPFPPHKHELSFCLMRLTVAQMCES